MATPLGARFVAALAARDHPQVASLLHPEVDFRGMTPGRFWEASTATQVVDEILRSWYGDRDQIDEVLQVETTWVADRERVGYRLAVSNPDGRFLVEQQAYYETSNGSITWMRIMCSGWRPVTDRWGGWRVGLDAARARHLFDPVGVTTTAPTCSAWSSSTTAQAAPGLPGRP